MAGMKKSSKSKAPAAPKSGDAYPSISKNSSKKGKGKGSPTFGDVKPSGLKGGAPDKAYNS